MARKRKPQKTVAEEAPPKNQHQTTVVEESPSKKQKQQHQTTVVEEAPSQKQQQQHQTTVVREDNVAGEDDEEYEEVEVEEYEDVEEEVEEEEEEEENDASSDSEPVEKLLEPFTKDLLYTLLREAAETHPDVADRIRRAADSDPNHRKIFVHGLGWDATTDALRDAFSSFGEIEDCKAVTDKISGKSKGYGFVVFCTRSGARKALKEPQKKIGSRVTSCQLASAGGAPGPAFSPLAPGSESTQRKIFVSNVGAEVDLVKLLEFFSKFGEIEEGPLGLDRATGKPKGFCLFIYKAADGARRALEEPLKNFEGQVLNCQKAIEGPKPGKFPNHQQKQKHYHHHNQNLYQHPYPYQQNVNPGFAGPAPAAALGQALTAAILAAAAGGPGYGNQGGMMGPGGFGGGGGYPSHQQGGGPGHYGGGGPTYMGQ